MTMVVAIRVTEPVLLEGAVFSGQFKRELQFVEEEGIQIGLVGVHVFTEPGLYELELRAVDDEGQAVAISTGIVVVDGGFGYERIDLPESRVGLLDAGVNRQELEYLASHQVFTPQRRWTSSFVKPCVGTISAYFGTHRAYDDGPYTSYHTGVDIRAPAGTPVHMPAPGRVVLAEALTVRGNAVVVDHGLGVLTGYWHLSAIEVQVGQQIAMGDLIGRVGNTGLSTGAHLHWEVWVGGTSVNGLAWLEETPLASEVELAETGDVQASTDVVD
jgi:murein DD-endopeptidase MepM/ murein hydrolase activator NlpD